MMEIDLSIMEKVKTVFKYFFSSFMSIELILIVICIFLFLFFNLKQNKKIVNIFVPITILLFIAFMALGFHDYAVAAIDEVIKLIMHYYYFPSMASYFVIMMITTVYLMYCVYTEKMSRRKKIFNYVFSCIMFIFFIGLFSYTISNNIGLSVDYSIYRNKYVLSFVQLSTLIFLIWMLSLIAIRLYNYFKKKYD